MIHDTDSDAETGTIEPQRGEASRHAQPGPLLPCPFCGGEASLGTIRYSSATIREQHWGQDTFHKVNCIRCGSDNLGLVGFATRELATEHWNRRVPCPVCAQPSDGRER